MTAAASMPARKWGKEAPAPAPRPTGLVSSRDNAPVPHVAGAARLAKAAEAAGWTVRLTYALADVPASARKARHLLHSVAVRLARGAQHGWAIWTREDEGRWGFAEAQLDWRVQGMRELTAALTVAAGTEAQQPAPPARPLDRPAPARADRPSPPRPEAAIAGSWAQVHVGDTVRGADQRVWTVVGRRPGATWIGSGVTEISFTFRLGEREVTARRAAHEPAPLVERADHTAAAAAFAALIEHQLAPTLLEETTLTTPDPFAAPAAAPAPIKYDRWNRYLLPDPVTGEERGWTRTTTIARTLKDEFGLNQWKLRMVAKGVALHPDLIAAAAAADPDEDKSELDKIAEAAKERAGGSRGANMGNALHNFTRRLDKGEALALLGVPASVSPDITEYRDTLARHRLKVRAEWAERVVVLPEYGIAGKLDRIVGQPTGVSNSKPAAIFDLKTGKDVSYEWLEIAIQLSIYAHATHMWDPVKRAYEPMPEVDQDRGLVLHLPIGKAHGQVYGVNLIEGWEAAQLAMRVRETRAAGKGYAWLVNPEPADLALHRVKKAGSRAELAALWDQLQRQGLWTEEVGTAATARLTELETAA